MKEVNSREAWQLLARAVVVQYAKDRKPAAHRMEAAAWAQVAQALKKHKEWYRQGELHDRNV